MTARGITTAAATAIAAETVGRCIAMDFDFPSAVIRLAAAPFDIIIGGETYLGLGQLVSVSGVQEAVELRSYGLTAQLSGIPRDAVALALTEAYRNRPAQLWEVVFDPATWQPVADPILMFRGRMDQMLVEVGGTCTVSVQLESRLRDWERAAGVLATHEEQQLRHAGDDFFAFVSDTAQRNIIWPAASFTK
jgi:hypothetical protein